MMKSYKLFIMYVTSLIFSANVVYADNYVQKMKTSIWNVDLELAGDNKFKIEATVFAIGDPVHETLTLQSLMDGGILSVGSTIEDDESAQFVRGVFWNDDPCAQLLANNDLNPLKPSFGYEWYKDFLKAKYGAGPEELKCQLLGRSHFGDLQFLHGMAAKDGVKSSVTAKKMMAWASVMYRVAIGEINYNIPLKIDSTAFLLLAEVADKSAMQLLRAKSKKSTHLRAFGSVLHMLQDSYAGGHVSRSPASNGERSGIIQFLSYINQDSKRHAHGDSWRNGSTDLEKTLNIPGAKKALEVSTKLVEFYREKKSWLVVKEYLENGPLYVRNDSKVSGPGDYQKLTKNDSKH